MLKLPDIQHFWRVIATLHNSDARSATTFISPVLRVTATRLFKRNRRNTRETIVVTYGALNYAGREFVKMCKRASEPFPLKRVQSRFWPKPRKQKK